MKNIIIIISVLLGCSSVCFSQSQNGKSSLHRMDYTDKDTVLPRYQLTKEQSFQIFSLNIELGQQERGFQRRYAASDSLNGNMNKLEDKKDLQYKNIVPNDKYQLYKQKKLKLIAYDNTVIK